MDMQNKTALSIMITKKILIKIVNKYCFEFKKLSLIKAKQHQLKHKNDTV